MLETRYRSVCESIATACASVGRAASEVNLLAVSKGFSAAEITPLLDLGHRAFAENRVQEAEAKWGDLRAHYAGVSLHLVGSLQSNKVKSAINLFDCIHSVDRESLAQRLASELQARSASMPLFIQVNIGDEPQKGGISLSALRDFCGYCRDDLGLDIVGLMGIPPMSEEVSPYFALLRRWCDDLGLRHLSMGMSGDYEIALYFGADYIRIGTALFGERAVRQEG